MDLGLRDKRAIVTGSSSGIGLAIATMLIEEGALVTLNGRSTSRLKSALVQTAADDFVSADVSTPEGATKLVTEFAARHRDLDLLVCNVGNGRVQDRLSNPQHYWNQTIADNLLSATYVMSAAEELLVASRTVVVCISSICGHEALGCPTSYAVSKAALDHFIKCEARRLGRRGVRINGVAPGNVMFPGSTWEAKQAENPVQVAAMLDRDVPLGRFASAEEIAAATVFLLSSRSSFISGHILIVDGGQTKS